MPENVISNLHFNFKLSCWLPWYKYQPDVQIKRIRCSPQCVEIVIIFPRWRQLIFAHPGRLSQCLWQWSRGWVCSRHPSGQWRTPPGWWCQSSSSGCSSPNKSTKRQVLKLKLGINDKMHSSIQTNWSPVRPVHKRSSLLTSPAFWWIQCRKACKWEGRKCSRQEEISWQISWFTHQRSWWCMSSCNSQE